jgi:hypothetical protein
MVNWILNAVEVVQEAKIFWSMRLYHERAINVS